MPIFEVTFFWRGASRRHLHRRSSQLSLDLSRISSLSGFTSDDRHTRRAPVLSKEHYPEGRFALDRASENINSLREGTDATGPRAVAHLPRASRTRELGKSPGNKPGTQSHRAFLCSDLLEELCQFFVEQSGHRRRLHLWEFAEK